jgi:hypothetical protein
MSGSRSTVISGVAPSSTRHVVCEPPSFYRETGRIHSIALLSRESLHDRECGDDLGVQLGARVVDDAVGVAGRLE